jgi:hypothetical protein
VALEKLSRNSSWGIAFLVAAGIVAEIIAKACSSPQTTHLNASTRASTLMLWVNVGTLEAAAFVAIAAWFDPAHRVPILLGGAMEAGITYGEYVYAKQAGLKSCEPGTETAGGSGSAPATAGAKGLAW